MRDGLLSVKACRDAGDAEALLALTATDDMAWTGSPMLLCEAVAGLIAMKNISESINRRAGARAADLDEKTRTRVLAAFAQAVETPTADGGCFISYSSKDEAFAKRLHADLENASIRCWFAPHDLPIGAKIRPSIDKAIRESGRVVLVLSANAISSGWVEKEVETTFEKEVITGRTLLLPIRLDAAIMEARDGWAADIRRQRNIGDFTGWRDRQSYNAALSRLLVSLDQMNG
jgi:hypothetical protein